MKRGIVPQAANYARDPPQQEPPPWTHLPRHRHQQRSQSYGGQPHQTEFGEGEISSAAESSARITFSTTPVALLR